MVTVRRSQNLGRLFSRKRLCVATSAVASLSVLLPLPVLGFLLLVLGMTPTAHSASAADRQRAAALAPHARRPIQLSEAHVAAVNRRRRIYVYDDIGSPARSFGIDLKLWRELHLKLYETPGQQVDTIGWCLDEGNFAAYPSKVLPVYDFPQFNKWRAAGIDIVNVMVQETRKMGKEVFWEYRVNGADTDFGKKGARWVQPPMKKQHPDWLMPGKWVVPHWNFSIPGVRKYKVAILRELAENYDFDGIDLDFSRTPLSLPQGRAWEERAALTAFVRDVRLMFQHVAHKRGRPLLLAVRVPSSVVGCHYDGYDVEAWVRENLVDIILPGDRSVDIDIAGFRRIIGRKNIKLIPSLEDYHSTTGYRHPPIEFFRGVYSNWWQQGADGVQTMNFFNVARNLSPEALKVRGRYGITPGQEQAYREIGNPEIMRLKDKMFVLQRRWGQLGGAGRWDFYQHTNCQSPLPVKIPADGLPTIQTLYLSDDLAANATRLHHVEMRILLTGTVNANIEVKLNGIRLSAPLRKHGWRTFKTTPRQFAVGNNLISIRLPRSADKSKSVNIERLEVHVDYTD